MKEMESAFESLPAAHQEVLRRCHARVQAFAKSQMASLVHMEMDIPGVSRNLESLMNLPDTKRTSQFCRREGRT